MLEENAIMVYVLNPDLEYVNLYCVIQLLLILKNVND